MARNSKGRKIDCGECKKFFAEDKLIADLKNNRYLCEGCYEPRDEEPDQDPEIERERCPRCGEYETDCECDKEEKEVDDGEETPECENSPRTVRGEARIARERTPKENSKLISW